MHMHVVLPYLHFIPCAFAIFIYTFIHIGSPEGITLLEFEAVGEEDQQESQPHEVLEGEEQVLEDLAECPDHKPSSYLKGMPRSILSLLCFTNIHLSPFMFDALGYRS